MATAGLLTPSSSHHHSQAKRISRRNTFSSFGDVDSSAVYPWNSPPLHPSPVPDTTSPVYPGRPIRPLPKTRIRDRLSAEHAAAIAFPPAAPESSPIFGYSYPEPEAEEIPQRRSIRAGSMSGQVPCIDCGHGHEHSESEEEEEDERHRTMQFSPDSLQITRRDGDYYGNGKLVTRADRNSKLMPTGSTASSADGYESFENMSNKKKRKIPQSGAPHGHPGHHSALSTDMANMGIAQHDGGGSEADEGAYSGASYGYAHNSPGAAGAGLSGPGRGRYGRSGRGSMDRRPLAPVQGEPGIISTAIANAAQQLPTTPNHKGQENMSMLQQHASKTPPQKTDFTFTPDGGDNRPVWPGQHGPGGPGPYPQLPTSSSRPTRRSQPNLGQAGPSQNGTHAPPPATHAQQPVAPPGQGQTTAAVPNPPPPKQKKPKKPGKIYAIAARQRKLQQEYQNYHNPPKREDVWICEFCEYEAIFGKPPLVLIRDYEKKDNAERKRLAERRRLLDKAKMKGRKGKKGSKNNKHNANHNNATTTNQPAAPAGNQQYDEPIDDEYYEDDEYDYGPDPALDLPPLPHTTPGAYPEDDGYDDGYGDDVDEGRDHALEEREYIRHQQAAVSKAALSTGLPQVGGP